MNICKVICLGILLGVLLFSCTKKETMEVDNETQSIVDHTIADQEFIAVISAACQAAFTTRGIGPERSDTLNSCDTLTYYGGDTSTFTPHPTFSLSLSDNSCALLNSDGKSRTGVLYLRATGKLTGQGTQLILKLGNYMADGIQYTCDSILATVQESSDRQITFHVKLEGGLCRTGDYQIRLNFNRTFSFYPLGNDEFSGTTAYVHGSSSGTNRHGRTFSANSIQGSPLVKQSSCRFIQKGMMELTPEGFKKRVVDFGNGTCDDLATFTVNENTIAFKLK